MEGRIERKPDHKGSIGNNLFNTPMDTANFAGNFMTCVCR